MSVDPLSHMGLLARSGRIGPRGAVIAVVNYQGRPAFDRNLMSYVEMFFEPRSSIVAATLHAWGAPLRRLVDGSGMPAIIALPRGTDAQDETSRIRTIADELVFRFGARPFVDGAVAICIDNFTDDGAAQRTATVRADGRDVTVPIVFIAQHASTESALHEYLHTWGAVDVYGHDGQRSSPFSLMSSTEGAGGQGMKLPDPWHRMALGLTYPHLVDVARLPERSATVLPLVPASRAGHPCLLLWDSQRGSGEYLLVELRTPAAYDGLPAVDSSTTAGFVVWNVAVDSHGIPTVIAAVGNQGRDRAVTTVGARNFLERGGWDPWRPSSGTRVVTMPRVPWYDGTSMRFRLRFRVDAADTFESGEVILMPFE